MVSYSHSVATLYRRCEKQYYFKWLLRRKQGWRKPVDHPWHQVYILSQIKHRQMWAGDVYHQAMALALSIFRSTRRVDEQFIRRAAREAADAQFQFSESHKFVNATKSKVPTHLGLPTFLALFEHAYGLPTEGILENIQNKVDQWLSNTFAWEGWPQLLDCIRQASNVYIEPNHLQYTIAGARLQVRMDVGIESANNGFRLYDWKCYRENARFADYDQEMFKRQLLTYAIWPVLRDKGCIPIERITAHVFNPISGEDTEVSFTPHDHAEFELDVETWVRIQRQIFTEVAEVDFEELAGPFDTQRSCPWCQYKAVCGKEIVWHDLT